MNEVNLEALQRMRWHTKSSAGSGWWRRLKARQVYTAKKSRTGREEKRASGGGASVQTRTATRTQQVVAERRRAEKRERRRGRLYTSVRTGRKEDCVTTEEEVSGEAGSGPGAFRER